MESASEVIATETARGLEAIAVPVPGDSGSSRFTPPGATGVVWYFNNLTGLMRTCVGDVTDVSTCPTATLVSGTVRFQGQEIQRLQSYQIARLGLGWRYGGHIQGQGRDRGAQQMAAMHSQRAHGPLLEG